MALSLSSIEPGALAILILALLATGALAGLIAGLLGLGGGIVIVPVLYYVFTLFGVDEAARMHAAVGTSLATIIPTALSSARAHWRRGSLDPVLLRALAPGVVLGVMAATAISAWIPGNALAATFGVVALIVAANMLMGGHSLVLAERFPAALAPRLGMGATIGSLSTLMGIGGGTLTVPLLSAFAVPVRSAVGTASAIGVVISIPGALGFALTGLGVAGRPPVSLGYVNLAGLVCIVPATVCLAPIGARLAHAVNPGRLRQVFALFLAFTAVRLLTGTLGS